MGPYPFKVLHTSLGSTQGGSTESGILESYGIPLESDKIRGNPNESWRISYGVLGSRMESGFRTFPLGST